MLQIKPQRAGSRSEWLVERRYTFGTGANNQYKVYGKDIAVVHAGLDVNNNTITLVNLAGGDTVTANGEPVRKHIQLQAGDVFAIGDSAFSIHDPKLERKQRTDAASKGEANTKANTKKSDSALHHQSDLDAAWFLKARNIALADKSYALTKPSVIGRSKECDIRLNLVHLSRRHARVTPQRDGVHIEDLDSANGTFLNGTQIRQAVAKAGDTIRFDSLAFTLYSSATQSHSEPDSNIDANADFDKTLQHAKHKQATGLRPALSEQAGATNAPEKEQATPSPTAGTRETQRGRAATSIDTDDKNSAATARVDTSIRADEEAEWSQTPAFGMGKILWTLILGAAIAASLTYYYRQ